MSAANAAYVEAVGVAGAAEARGRAARFRRANRMRGLQGNSDYMLERQRELIRASNAENDALNALNDRATAAHVAANRADLEASNDGNRTDAALDELIIAARETFVVLVELRPAGRAGGPFILARAL